MKPQPGTPRRRNRAGVTGALLVTAGVLASALTGCGGDDPRGVPGFCRLLRERGAELTDTADPGALVELYRELDARAPLQIKDAWHEVTELIERVNTFNPKSEEDTQRMITESLRAQSSVRAVGEWADTKCKVPLGSITAPGDSVPVSVGPLGS